MRAGAGPESDRLGPCWILRLVKIAGIIYPYLKLIREPGGLDESACACSY